MNIAKKFPANVVCLVADNCQLNYKIADLLHQNMIGCRSHHHSLQMDSEASGGGDDDDSGGGKKPIGGKASKMLQ